VRLQRPDKKRLAREKACAKSLAVAGPQLLLSDDAARRAEEEVAEDPGDRIVEPDDELGARPDEITPLRVVAVDDPPLPRRRLNDAAAERLGVGFGPVRFPVQRIKLDVRRANDLGDSPGGRRLAGAGRADDDDPGREGISC